MKSAIVRLAVTVVATGLLLSGCGSRRSPNASAPAVPRVEANSTCADWWSQSTALQLRIANLYRNTAVDTGRVPSAPQLRAGIDAFCRADHRRSLSEAVKAAIWAFQR